MNPKVLIVEDDRHISRVLDLELTHEGFSTMVAEDGRKAIELSEDFSPDIILLDIMIPKIDGLTVAKELKESFENLGIIAITAKSTLNDKLAGFRSGVDDYVTKPFEIEEIVARIRALLNRMNLGEQLRIGELEIRTAEMRVFVEKEEVFLTPTEFRLISELVKARGTVLSKEDLLENVWGFSGWENQNVVEVYINYLRKKLGKAASMIKTVRGVGYAFRKD